jgi:hypothetical protein
MAQSIGERDAEAVVSELLSLYQQLAAELAAPAARPSGPRGVATYQQIVPLQHQLGELLATDRADAEHDKNPALIEESERGA